MTPIEGFLKIASGALSIPACRAVYRIYASIKTRCPDQTSEDKNLDIQSLREIVPLAVKSVLIIRG